MVTRSKKNPPIDIPQEALLLAALASVKRRAGEMEDATKARLLGALTAIGATQTHAKLPNGDRVATIGVTEPKDKARVVDEAALIAWLKVNNPDAIEVVPERVIPATERVRPEFFEGLKAAGSGAVTEHGEPVAGVIMEAGVPYIRTSSLKADDIFEAIRQRALAADDILALGDGATVR